MDEYSQFIEELKRKATIVDVASKYTQLVRRGARIMACCPLHVEKTPSFCLYENTNSYYCFGCHAAGDSIKLVEEMERTDFKGAVEILAQKYGMEVPTFKKGDMESLAALKKKKDRLYELMKDAANHYYTNLMSPKGEKAREYLAGRGLSIDTIKKFGLGYAVDSTDLVKFLKSKGYTYEEMSDARVAFRGNKGEFYDPQSERFITPIVDKLGHVIAFGGRVVLNVDHTVKKYYNSMESDIYHKTNELFAANIVKGINPRVKDVILVEGYMDVISLYQAGIHNAVASCGTALTSEQARLIKSLLGTSTKVYYMYDGDEAGQNGMIRGVDILKQEGLDVYVVVLEDNADPDEYIKKYGYDGMMKKIKSAIPMYEYKIQNVAKKYNLKSVEDRGQFAAEAINAISAIPSRVQAEPFIAKIESMSGINTQTLNEQFEKAKEGMPVKIVVHANEKPTDAYTRALRYILYAAFGGIEGVHVKDEYFDCCRTEETQELYSIFRSRQDELTIEDLKALKDENSEVEKILAIGENVQSIEAAQKMFVDCRKRVLKEGLEQKRKELAVDLDNEKDEETKLLLLTQLSQLQRTIREVSK